MIAVRLTDLKRRMMKRMPCQPWQESEHADSVIYHQSGMERPVLRADVKGLRMVRMRRQRKLQLGRETQRRLSLVLLASRLG